MDDKTEVSPRVLAVVVTHNGEPWLESCLESLSRQSLDIDVVVVDSGSRTSAESLVSRVLPEAEFVRMGSNVGFGAAANHALEVATRAPETDLFLFLHDDVLLEPEATSLLVATAVETEAGIVGGKGLDWDQPEILLEVGMSADQFAYPFAGLEEGEIDQGQHDTRREALYVTSACMLTSRALVERIGLWDGGYFAFGEDLDLCTRARISGFRVTVEPGARFRHAVALANKLRDCPAAREVRFYTRRNRPRVITKNVAAYRLPFVLAAYSLLAMAEMVFLAAFRRFDEINAYPRAFVSFAGDLPDIIRRRRAVQKRRAVPDRRLRRLMVSDLHRARVFLERRASDWERGTLALGKRTFAHLAPAAIKASAAAWLRKPPTIAFGIFALVFLYAARSTLTGAAIASGSIWPFPDSTGRLLDAYLDSWRNVGMGTESAAPVALPLLWMVSLLSGGKSLLAQKMLIFILGLTGVLGINRFVSRRTSSSPARVVAVVIYALGPLVQLIFEQADLAALALFAIAPFILEIGLRMLGTVPAEDGERPPTAFGADTMSRDLLRLSLVTAFGVALGPSAIVACASLWLVVVAHSLVGAWDKRETLRRGLWVLGSIPVALLLLMPWSFEALRPSGAMLGAAFSDSYDSLWNTFDLRGFVFLDQAYPWTAVAMVAGTVVGALAVAGLSRRRESRVLAVVWLVFAAVGTAAARGILPVPVVAPSLWLVIPLAAIAATAGHLVAGARDELPRHAVGWRHVGAGAAGLAMFGGVIFGWVPELSNWDRPNDTLASRTKPGSTADSISSYLVTTAKDDGDFRVLWLGKTWVDPIRSGSRPGKGSAYLLTDPGGLTMLDSAYPPASAGEGYLDETVESLVGLRVHLVGHLLAPANIRYLIVDPRDEESMTAARRQRDMKLEQQQNNVAIFVNLDWLPRAAIAPAGIEGRMNSKDLMTARWSGGRRIERRDTSEFSGHFPPDGGSQLLLSENFNPGWDAQVDGRGLKQSQAFGWSNRFELSGSPKGILKIVFRQRWVRVLWLLVQSLVLIVAFGMARSARTDMKGWLR